MAGNGKNPLINKLPLASMCDELFGSSTPYRRDVNTFSAQQKVDAVERAYVTGNLSQVAREVGVAESTLRGWRKAVQKLRDKAWRDSLTAGSDPSSSSSANGGTSTGDERYQPCKRMKLDNCPSSSDGANEQEQQPSDAEKSLPTSQMSNAMLLQQWVLEKRPGLPSLLATLDVQNPFAFSILLQQLFNLNPPAFAFLIQQIASQDPPALPNLGNPQAVGAMENGLQWEQNRSENTEENMRFWLVRQHYINAQLCMMFNTPNSRSSSSSDNEHRTDDGQSDEDAE